MPFLYLAKAKHDGNDKPIACVQGGEAEGHVLFLSQSEARPLDGPIPSSMHNLGPYKSAIEKMSSKKRTREDKSFYDKITDALISGTTPVELEGVDERQRDLYQRIYDDHVLQRRVVLPIGSSFRILVTPDPKARQVFYIAGQSGSGKSWILRQLAQSYHKFFPDRGIYLISALGEDETLDSMRKSDGKPVRIPVRSFIDDPPTLQEVSKCFCIFDDYDTIKGKEGEAVCSLIDQIATMGRHNVSTMACASHHLTNYSKTRLILAEATHLVVFPMTTGKKPLQYLLSTYASMDDDEIAGLYGLHSRWIAIGKGYPPYLVSEHEARIIHRI
jgi:hypothetical protein